MGILNLLKEESAGISLLYVEDERSIREQTAAFLQRFFDPIEVCRDGKEGLASYEKRRHDIVVTDIRMPQMDGLAMSKEIKKLNKKAEIVITTAFSEKELLLEAIDIGVEQYVLKPIEGSLFASALLKTIRTLRLEKRTQMLYERIQNILNFQDNLLFVTDLEHINTCNRAFLRFFAFSGLKTLKENRFDIAALLLQDSHYLKTKTAKQFYRYLLDNQEKNIRIKLMDKKTQEEHIFIAKINPLPHSNEYIVSLTDITDFDRNYQTLEYKATHDPLTKAYNRLKFESVIESEISRTLRYGVPLSLCLFDVDDFKHKNELYGSSECNMALVELSDLVRKNIRNEDLFSRYGDDAFVVLLPHVSLSGAFEAAEKLRRSIATHPFTSLEALTCSFGVVQFLKEEGSETFLQRAFRMLKNAKEDGKNCVRTDTELEQKLRDEVQAKEQELILKQLEVLASKNETVVLYMFYKGLSVSNVVNIKGVDLANLHLSVVMQTKKLSLLGHVHECYIIHDSFAGTIKAELLRGESDQNLAVLRDLKMVPTAPTHRKMLRITPDREMEATILTLEQAVRGVILDLSLGAISVRCGEVKGILLGSDVRISFKLKCEKHDKEMVLEGKVLKLIEEEGGRSFRVVLGITINKEAEEAVLEYISKRQIELLKEVNGFML